MHDIPDGDIPPDAVITARIEIVRYFTASDTHHSDITALRHWQGDEEGDDVPLIELLGLLRVAEDTAIRQAMENAEHHEHNEGVDGE